MGTGIWQSITQYVELLLTEVKRYRKVPQPFIPLLTCAITKCGLKCLRHSIVPLRISSKEGKNKPCNLKADSDTPGISTSASEVTFSQGCLMRRQNDRIIDLKTWKGAQRSSAWLLYVTMYTGFPFCYTSVCFIRETNFVQYSAWIELIVFAKGDFGYHFML